LKAFGNDFNSSNFKNVSLLYLRFNERVLFMVKKSLIVADISIVPVGSGTSISKFIKAAIKIIEENGVKFSIGPMSTTVEVTSLNELFLITKKIHEVVFGMGALRIITTIKIDDRKDKKLSIKSKLNSIEDF